MIHIQWSDPAWVASQVYESMTKGLFDNSDFTPIFALQLVLLNLAAFAFALYILAYPPRHRKLSIVLLSIPVTFVFWHHQQATPSLALSDNYGRFLYIWLAHMSYEVTILEYEPPHMEEDDGWRRRLQEAYKVLFARHHKVSMHETQLADLKHDKSVTESNHTYSKTQFLLRHTWTIFYSCVAQYTWWAFTSFYVVDYYTPKSTRMAYFFRRLPGSFTAEEMWSRFSLTFNWCIVNMFFYEAYHSLFAIIFVGLGADTPSRWSMSLFGSVSEAWSVRRYWGKHWHNYIYHSFTSHTKIVTREWLGMRRGSHVTRLLENTIVFAVSGFMHSLVRLAQDSETYECWTIAIWYFSQMLPIIAEGIIQGYWHRTKKELGLQGRKWVRVFERTIGYAWVLGWKMWCIPKYMHTRYMWSQYEEIDIPWSEYFQTFLGGQVFKFWILYAVLLASVLYLRRYSRRELYRRR
ncbi:membrane bound O-acyl transferase family-domain-containing protein [Phaeosphaeriaceae sp. PMI808]|nr:membrane bound O-acyl transferase family-domain-containing protein [Phaeosphaeriaceae sp. PMI808]